MKNKKNLYNHLLLYLHRLQTASVSSVEGQRPAA